MVFSVHFFKTTFLSYLFKKLLIYLWSIFYFASLMPVSKINVMTVWSFVASVLDVFIIFDIFVVLLRVIFLSSSKRKFYSTRMFIYNSVSPAVNLFSSKVCCIFMWMHLCIFSKYLSICSSKYNGNYINSHFNSILSWNFSPPDDFHFVNLILGLLQFLPFI